MTIVTITEGILMIEGVKKLRSSLWISLEKGLALKKYFRLLAGTTHAASTKLS